MGDGRGIIVRDADSQREELRESGAAERTGVRLTLLDGVEMGVGVAQGWASDDDPRRRILFVVNADWFFLSHRRALAEAARAAGYEVFIATPDTGKAAEITDLGFNYFRLPASTKGMTANPIREAKVLLSFYLLFRRLNPDIIHLSTPKVVTYGGIAARLAGRIPVVNLVSGLGFAFSDSRKAKLINPIVRLLYRIALRNRGSRTVFQNVDDQAFFLRSRFVQKSQVELIRGSGVDCRVFTPSDEPDGPRIVLLPARLLWDKGVGEFVEAARLLKMDHHDVRFVIVGKPDKGNPMAIPEDQVRQWVREGYIEWWGHRSDMADVIASSSIVVLPSYHEGLPKVLLEAAASARPIVATDIAGCKEVVTHEVNGLTVPVRDSGALADAIDRLLSSALLRREYGQAGRDICVQNFDERYVQRQFLHVCAKLLGDDWAMDIAAADDTAFAGVSDRAA